MKWLFILFGLFVSSSLMAQFHYGVELGGGISGVYNDGMKNPHKYFRGGGMVNYEDTDHYLYECGLILEMQEVKFDDFTTAYQYFRKIDAQLAYLTIPLSLGYFWRFGAGMNQRFSFKAGGFVSLGIFGTGDVILADNYTGEITNPFKMQEYAVGMNSYTYEPIRKFNGGLLIAAEYLYKQYSIRINYTLGLAHLNKVYFPNKTGSYSISLALGYYFN